MATLILSAVGRLFGGPIGGAVGAVLGQSIDNRLFAPKGRQGPRLSDLTVQSSTYGAALPKLFGRTRVAGSVIWASDLIEDRRKVSSGKGRPKQTLYSYSANFAVALSARPISRIGRIWADGKLLRGEAGDFKTATQFRLHNGGEGQAVDPLMAASEGAGQAPAYRGLAYAMFEDFQLAEYGNRIPSLSFEVIADESDISIGDIIAGVTQGGVDADCPTRVDGMAVSGDSVSGLVGMIDHIIPLLSSGDGEQLRISENPMPGPIIFDQHLGAATGGKAEQHRLERSRRSLAELPGRHMLSYLDGARDYQPGAQSLFRPDLGPSQAQSEFAATLSASKAKALIEQKVASDVAERETVKLSLPPHYFGLMPGALISIPGLQGEWQVDEANIEGMVIKLLLHRQATGSLRALAGEPGRALSQPDLLHGSTVLRIVETPWLASGTAQAPSLYAVAAGALPGWRQAALLQSDDGGVSFQEIGATAAPAMMGQAASVLGSASPLAFDRKNVVIVTLLHDQMQLSPASEAALIGGQNLALLGDELIQFARAERLSPATYRLSMLLRGRRGTEGAIASHSISEAFTLIESDALLPLSASRGQPLQLLASGIADPSPVAASFTATAVAQRPLSPVHLRYERLANGDTLLSWTRRSREGWRWIDGIDAPLTEESERYELGAAPDVGALRPATLSVAQWNYDAGQRAADLAAGATSLTVTVSQMGTFGTSPATMITLPLL